MTAPPPWASIPGKKAIKFAVYPDYATGRQAQARRLKEGNMYIDLTLNELPRKYTGLNPKDPDTQEVINYRKAIKFFTKLDMERTIRQLLIKLRRKHFLSTLNYVFRPIGI